MGYITRYRVQRAAGVQNADFTDLHCTITIVPVFIYPNSYITLLQIPITLSTQSPITNHMPEEMKPCPQCESPYGYITGDTFTCPECGHEWDPAEEKENGPAIKDANGNILQDGDSVVIIKDLPVKGASKAIKAGTKVKNIRLTDGDHNIDCKIEGFGAMALKSEFVRKA
jgi:protein PhnA